MKSIDKATLTVFTPTYNRANELKRLYASLCSQSKYILEWVIVDDGSTDNTYEVVEKFKKEQILNIRYAYQNNQGKHIAINTGANMAKGEFFFIIDSDDYLEKNALNKASKWINEIRFDDSIAGIGGTRVDNKHNIIGKTFRGKFLNCSNLQREKYNIFGDKAEIYKTKVLKQYKFPKIKGENFITEALIWNRIAHDGYYIKWINEPYIICNYQEDGLTKNRILIQNKNYKGYLLYYKELISFTDNPVNRLKYKVAYYNIAKGHLTDKQIKKGLNANWASLLIYKTLNYSIKVIKK